MDYYKISKDDFSKYSRFKFNVVKDIDELNDRISTEIVELIERNNRMGKPTSLILPVGPLDYRYLAEKCNKMHIDLSQVEIFMMDEYLGEDGKLIPEDHPLSFRRFMRKNFLDNLDQSIRSNMMEINFPAPEKLKQISKRIEEIGGVDVCYGGFGITGHFAFNDPPEPGEIMAIEEMRNIPARVLTISRESTTQMAMGGTNGNLEILPKKAVSLGMKELLASRKIHLTFMRSWHAGVLRRALFGPVTVQCPGSLIQEHPNVEVTLTELAAEVPRCDLFQNIGK